MAVRYEYDRLTAAQFCAALREIDMTPEEFARISGWRYDLVQKWMHGEKELPHQVFPLLSLLTLPGAVDLATRVTNLVARVQHWNPSAEESK